MTIESKKLKYGTWDAVTVPAALFLLLRIIITALLSYFYQQSVLWGRQSPLTARAALALE